MKIININGPINAGKTTVSKLLAAKIPLALFIEVDALLSDEELEILGLTKEEGWRERVKRLADIINKEKEYGRYSNIIFAYPMTENLYHQWKLWEDSTTKFVNITLAPQLKICLQNRGKRELNEYEKNRIKEMYRQGYHKSKFADLIIDNSSQKPEETLQQILLYIGSIK